MDAVRYIYSQFTLYLSARRGVHNSFFAQIWKIKAPLKVKIFVWIVLHRKVLTVDNLRKRGWSGEESCVFCLDVSETVDHLFVECQCIKALLSRFLPNKQFLLTCKSVCSLWDESRRKGGTIGIRELASIYCRYVVDSLVGTE